MQTMNENKKRTYNGNAVARRAKNMEKELAKLLGRGLSYYQIGIRMGMTGATVSRYAKLLGLNKRSSFISLNDMEDKIRDLYDKGVPIAEMGDRIEVSPSLLRNWISDRGWTRRHPSITRGMNRISTRTQTIFEMRHAGKSLQQIGDEFGVTRERVRQILAKYDGFQNLDRAFAENAMLLIERGFNWDQIGGFMGVENFSRQVESIRHLFREEEQAKYLS